MIAILMLLSCQTWDDFWAEGLPTTTLQVPLVKTVAHDVRRLDDYLAPGDEWLALEGIPKRLEERCLAGEDIRTHLSTRLSLVEVLPEAIWVAGERVVTLSNWQAEGTKKPSVKKAHASTTPLRILWLLTPLPPRDDQRNSGTRSAPPTPNCQNLA